MFYYLHKGVTVSLQQSKVFLENTSSTEVCVTLSTHVNTRQEFMVPLKTEAGTAIGMFVQYNINAKIKYSTMFFLENNNHFMLLHHILMLNIVKKSFQVCQACFLW